MRERIERTFQRFLEFLDEHPKVQYTFFWSTYIFAWIGFGFVLVTLISCGTVERIVGTSEKIIQGEVYYQARKGRAEIEEATIDAKKNLKKRELKIDGKLKEFERQLEDQLKEKRKKRKLPPEEIIEHHCKKKITLLGVKKKCD